MARTHIGRSWPEGFNNRRPGSGVAGGGNGHEQAVGSEEGGLVTNRQWGQRMDEWSRTDSGVRKGNGHEQAVGSQEGEWSRTGSGVTGGGNGHEQAVTGGGDGHEQAIGSEEGGLVTNRQWGHRKRNGHEQAVGSREVGMVTNGQWGHMRRNGHEQTVGS